MQKARLKREKKILPNLDLESQANRGSKVMNIRKLMQERPMQV